MPSAAIFRYCVVTISFVFVSLNDVAERSVAAEAVRSVYVPTAPVAPV
jgi:Flp pilus assembly protein protease CpaA